MMINFVKLKFDSKGRNGFPSAKNNSLSFYKIKAIQITYKRKFNSTKPSFARYVGPDRRFRTILKNFLLKFWKKSSGFIVRNFLRIKNFIKKIFIFIFYKFFWFLIKPLKEFKLYFYYPLRISLKVLIKAPLEILAGIFSVWFLDFLKNGWDVVWVHFWFSPLKYLGNKSTAVFYYKLALGIALIDEDYELPKLPMTFKELVFKIVDDDIKERRSKDIETEDYYKPNHEQTKAFEKLEPLLASRHDLEEDLQRGRADGSFKDFYLVVEDLRSLGFEEKHLKQVDFWMLFFFNRELVQYARRYLNMRIIDGNHLLKKEDLLKQLELKPELLDWGKGLLRNKVNIYLHLERERKARQQDRIRLGKQRDEIVKRIHPLLGKAYQIFIGLVEGWSREEDEITLEHQQYEEEQDREDGIEEFVNYDIWSFSDFHFYYNFLHSMRLMEGSYFVRRLKQFLLFLGVFIVGIATFISFLGFANLCIEIFLVMDNYFGEFFAEMRIDPEGWAYFFGRFSFYMSKLKQTWLQMFYSFLMEKGYEVEPTCFEVDDSFDRELDRDYILKNSIFWELDIDQRQDLINNEKELNDLHLNLKKRNITKPYLNKQKELERDLEILADVQRKHEDIDIYMQKRSGTYVKNDFFDIKAEEAEMHYHAFKKIESRFFRRFY